MNTPSDRPSPKSTSPGSDPFAARLSPATGYAIAAVVSGLFISVWFSPNDSLLIGVFAACFVLMLTLRTWTIAVMLLLIQIELFLVEPHSINAFSQSDGSAILAVAVLALLIFTSRFLCLTSPPIPYPISLRSSIRAATLHARRVSREALAPFGWVPRDASSVSSSEVVTMLVRIVVPVAAVSVLLALIPLIPLDPLAPNYARLIPPAVRTITLGVILLLICVITNSLLSVLSWRRLSVLESRIYIRSVLSKWIHREITAVVKRQLKLRKTRRR